MSKLKLPIFVISLLLVVGCNGNSKDSAETKALGLEEISDEEKLNSGALISTTGPGYINDESDVTASPIEEQPKKPSQIVESTTTAPVSINKQLTDFEILRQRIVPDFIAIEKLNAGKLSKDIKTLATAYVEAIQNDGRWKDVNYSTYTSAELHLKRTRVVAAAYSLTLDKKYESATISALKFWFDLTLASDRWWEEVVVPHYLSTVGLLLGDALTHPLKSDLIKTLPSFINISLSGIQQRYNQIGVIYRGIISKDSQLVTAGLSDIRRVIQQSSKNGIQSDWSYHQHGPQLYSGLYGFEFLSIMLEWAYRVRDLEWKFSEPEIDILASFLLDGLRWMDRSGQFDYNVLGRAIARQHLPSTKVSSVPTILDKAELLFSGARAEQVKAYKAHISNNKGSGLTGFKHFWRSDYTVTATDDFMFGIRMNSMRTEPTENGEGENLLGYWLGFGSYFLLQTGKEYQNIFPVWDWTKVPGVTAPEYQEAPYYWGNPMQNVSFVGGATNNRFGVTAMVMDMSVSHLERIEANQTLERGERKILPSGESNTKAKKSWFSFGDQIVALGTDITSTHSESVNTSVNQTLLNGTVTLSNGDNIPLSEGVVSVDDWIHHDDVGYVFLNGSRGVVSVKPQTGSWSAIHKKGPTEIVSKNVFNLYVPHGINPTNSQYQYIVLPSRSALEIADYVQSIPIDVLENSSKVQAVQDSVNDVTGAVFYSADEIVVSPDYTVKVNKPSVVVLDKSGLGLKVSASTPGVEYQAFNIDITHYGEKKRQRVVTPGSLDFLGQSITFDFMQGQDLSVLDNPSARRAYMTLLPEEDLFVQGGAHVNSSYGLSGYMQLKNGMLVNDRHILLRYDLSSISGQSFSKATLRFYVRGVVLENGTESQIAARLIKPSSSWSEAYTTYGTFPFQSEVLGESKPTVVRSDALNHWVEVDVTDLIISVPEQERNNLSFEIVDLAPDYGANYVSFATKEHQNKGPQLVLE